MVLSARLALEITAGIGHCLCEIATHRFAMLAMTVRNIEPRLIHRDRQGISKAEANLGAKQKNGLYSQGRFGRFFSIVPGLNV